ncbi:hypothetical protein [Alicyclobacillus vulcanalis]|uniref:Uncharacterized protein n=1 Tax=Alicyclobacillus vulcanalis TaxID=252246 RepID=A0A1N7PSW3_9BACL|nr:hypothetical protein [Alicyclobacillus vulcanalis]SIT13743.1 hypothetical protein SAMN05421799_1173 [Alicyclobacillus vulcanalis]
MNLWNTLVQLAQTKRLSTLIVGLLASAKLITDALGLPFITDPQINAIANAVASIITVIAIFLPHTKAPAAIASQAPAGDLSHSSAGTPGAGTPNGSGSSAPSVASSVDGTANTLGALQSQGQSPQQASDGYARPPGA